MIRPHHLVLTLAACVLMAPLASFAEATKIYRIGYVSTSGPDTPPVKGFKDGMRELGYVEGQNLVIDWHFARGRAERLPSLVREALKAKPDIIAIQATQAAEAAAVATRSTPIVMVVVSDAVGSGLVRQLSRPGGNITGMTMMMPELSAKRLQLVNELLPNISEVAVLWNPADPPRLAEFQEVQDAALKLGIKVQPVKIRRLDQLDIALGEIVPSRVQALLVLSDPFTTNNRTKIIDFAAKHQLPVISSYGYWAVSGALMSFGTDLYDLARRSAAYVDKILKGAKPGDLPVEQPTKFELVLNLKAANALGIKIPQAILLRADQVIQ